MYLFFDTETTGLPKNWKAPVSDVNNWPRLVQIAWLIYNESGEKIDSKNFIIKPVGFVIPGESSGIHGITTERALAEGDDLIYVLALFSDYINRSSMLVAHNMQFDEKIVGAEFIRKNIKNKLFSKERICTMLGSRDFCAIPGSYGLKWPTLSELHIKLFGEDFENAHDAYSDITATANCFWKLKELQIL
ncbi:MAG: 3'-5' exonuclease [Candidatus Aminicenantes bacterium]|nr:3'-5' exonuclease [Candidatus Aminicenantes bacterium]